MTLYLTDATAPEEIDRARAQRIRARREALSGRARPRIRMPASPTSGKTYAVLERMQRARHAAARARRDRRARKSTCSIARSVFIDETARAAGRALPALKVVFEHITTARAVEFVAAARAGGRRDHHPAASPAQSQRDFFGRHPAAFLLPADSRSASATAQALVQAATGGSPSFFLGTDSAPHERSTKENACGCAGMFTAHAAIELYAEVFESGGAPRSPGRRSRATSAPISTACRATRSASR